MLYFGRYAESYTGWDPMHTLLGFRKAQISQLMSCLADIDVERIMEY